MTEKPKIYSVGEAKKDLTYIVGLCASAFVYGVARNIAPVAAPVTAVTFSASLFLFPPRKDVGVISRVTRFAIRGALAFTVGFAVEIGCLVAGMDIHRVGDPATQTDKQPTPDCPAGAPRVCLPKPAPGN